MIGETVTEILKICQHHKFRVSLGNHLVKLVLIGVVFNSLLFHVEGSESECYYHEIGFYYSDMGEYELAIKYFDKAIELGQDGTNEQTNLPLNYVFLNRGTAYLRLGYSLKAGGKQDAEKYIRQGRLIIRDAVINDIGLAIAAGRCYYELEDYKRAQFYSDKALEIKKNDAHALNLRGKTYLKLGQFEKAIADFSDAMRERKHPDDFHYLGKTYFEMKNYEKCEKNYQEANRLLKKRKPLGARFGVDKIFKMEIEYIYDMARLRYEQKRFSEAIDDFNRFRDYVSGETVPDRKTPVLAKADYYLALCYWKLGELPKAKEKFEHVLAMAKSDLIRQKAKEWLETIGAQEVKPYTLYFMTGLKYDDNVPLDPVDHDVHSEKKDFALEGHFKGTYDFDIGKMKISAGYDHYQNMHFEIDEYDLTGSLPNVCFKYAVIDEVAVSFAYLPSFYWLDSSKYLFSNRLKTMVNWAPTDNFSLGLSYAFSKNDYHTDDEKDGDANEAFIDFLYEVSPKLGYLTGMVGFEDNSANEQDRSYTRWKIDGSIGVILVADIRLRLAAQYHITDYKNTDSFYLHQREDAQYSAEATLSRKVFYDWLGIQLKYSYWRNNSNISVYEYERNTSSVSLAFTF